jgi:hypothetical protein
MKTKMNNSGIRVTKSLLVLFLFVLSLSRSFGQGYCEARRSLDSTMNRTEEALRYVAPDLYVAESADAEMNRLNALAASIEASVKYVAPQNEDEDVRIAMQNLDNLAALHEISAKYNAPFFTERLAEDDPQVSAEQVIWAKY